MHEIFAKPSTEITIIYWYHNNAASSAESTSEHGGCVTIIKNGIFSRTPLNIEMKQTPYYYNNLHYSINFFATFKIS